MSQSSNHAVLKWHPQTPDFNPIEDLCGGTGDLHHRCAADKSAKPGAASFESVLSKLIKMGPYVTNTRGKAQLAALHVQILSSIVSLHAIIYKLFSVRKKIKQLNLLDCCSIFKKGIRTCYYWVPNITLQIFDRRLILTLIPPLSSH